MEATSGGDGPGQEGKPPASINLAAVAGAVLLIGLVAFGVYRMNRPAGPAAGAVDSESAAAAPDAPVEGTPIVALVPVKLTPEATVVAERYRCVCGCNDPLNVCTCGETPGSRDMKQYVQELVDQKNPPAAIDAAMVERYGAGALMSNPPPKPAPPPASR